MEFVAETRQLLEIVANSLYSEKEVFLRELISNCSDALEKLRYIQVAGDTIQDPGTPLQINIATGNQELTIEDTGVGMSYDEMVEYLGTIARSSSKSFLQEMEEKGNARSADNVIGRFGVGFYSAFMVADLVEVFSRSWKVGSKCYRWASTGVGGFEVAEAGPEHSQNLRGTKIVLHLKENANEYSTSERIKSIITKYSNFVQFPIFLSGNKVNMQDPVWMLDPKKASSEQHTEFYKFLTGESMPPMYTFHFKLDMPININALFYVPNLRSLGNPIHDDPSPKVSLYSRRVLIQHQNTKFLPAWMRFVVGVVDSEDIPLNLSREMLQNSSLILKMKNIITSRILRGLEAEMESNKTQFAQLFSAVGLYFREGIVHSDDSRTKEEIASLLMFESSKESERSYVSLNDYVKRMQPSQEEIFYSYSTNRLAVENSPYAEDLLEKGIEILYSYSQYDDTIMTNLEKFKGKKITSIEEHATKNLDTSKASSSSDGKFKEFTNWFENVLGKDKVKHVKISNSLKKQPSILTVPELTRTRSLLMNTPEISRAWEYIAATLHLNPDHELVKRVDILRKKQPDLAASVAEQVYYNSLISAGLVKDARFMLPHLDKLLEKCIENSTQSTILTPN